MNAFFLLYLFFFLFFFFFFFNDTATTEIYTLSLHDALPFSSFFIRSPVRNQASPVSNTLRRIFFSVSAWLAYPSKRVLGLLASLRILPITSPTSFGWQRMQNPCASRIGCSFSISKRTTAVGNLCATNHGTRPTAPALPSKLNMATLPSVAA